VRSAIRSIGRGGVAAWPLAARALQRERVRRLGVLMSGAETDPEMQARLTGFRRAWEDLDARMSVIFMSTTDLPQPIWIGPKRWMLDCSLDCLIGASGGLTTTRQEED